MFHLEVYSEAVGSVTDSDINAADGQVFGIRNNHLIVTEPLSLIAAYGLGALMSRIRFGNAQFVVDVQPHIYPFDVSATVPDDPAVMDLRHRPIPLPQEEEITVLGTTTAVGPSDVNLGLFLAQPSYNRNLPPGDGPYWIRATATVVAGAESAWTNPVNLAFERDPRAGVYAVIGASVVAANATFFRLRFPDTAPINGKQWRPGGMVQDTVALAPWQPQVDGLGGLGVWGYWRTFTPPQIQTFDDTAGGTFDVFLKVIRVADSQLGVLPLR